MSIPREIHNPVYLVGNKAMSIHELLRRFVDERYQSNGIPRISDLHMKVGEPVRYRFDAELVPLPNSAPLAPHVLEELLFPLMTEEQVGRLKGAPPQDVDAGFDSEDLGVSFRINAFHDREGIAATIRALPRSVPDIEDIDFPFPDFHKQLAQLGQGLVVVTGTTGSGKSTTIASLIQYINRNRHTRIITLEDPIEYVLASDKSLISQREVGRHISSFHAGLRSALREDPDIIFVGEMRDPETTQLAMTAAETGHLVLSTLHTKDTRGALTRIVDMYPAERTKEIATQLSFSLSYVIGQKLVSRANSPGRRAAFEVLRNIHSVGNAIRTGTWHQIYSILQTQAQHGLCTLERHLRILIDAGEISEEDARRAANTPDAIQ